MVRRWWIRLMIIGLILGIGAFAAYRLYRWYRNSGTGSNNYIVEWLTDPASHEVLKSEAFSRCPNAPFILPTEGFIGLLWNDASAPYNFTSRHTGLDIFGYGTVGTIPIYAVYEGWLTRHEDWRSTVSLRSSTTKLSVPPSSYLPVIPYCSSKSATFGKIATFISSYSAGFGSMAQT
jgi:hypothetical protein